MPRYYFHLLNGSERNDDPEGCELPNDKLAIIEATTAAREMVVEAVLQGAPVGRLAFEVVDQDNRLIVELPFISVVRE
ncbi:DUF6894 family protein [Rhizobium sp. TRM95796]|uniref:DUF6894 family protein n=1 Tax=Rhizobium sp. TRM95796 TaxID=2979862 RepID=UPI0021E761DB|nr:hypothetical protein [Rhizobium sp. TRM95796]MCV3768672.1 hypothetical protein [Rhizobium sp. TRM95796]